MYLYIKQKNKKFVFRKQFYQTPVEIMFDKSHVSNIINQLYKQNINDYVITAINNKNILKTSISENIIDSVKTSSTIKKPKKEDGIKNILNELLSNSKTITSQIHEISMRTIQSNDIVSTKTKQKTKDDENTFIPQIDTKGMGIKTNVKTEKSSKNASSSADILRQLLKGI